MSSFLPHTLRLSAAQHLDRRLDLSNEPALEPPKGTVPNLVDPPNQNMLVMSVVVLCLVITTLLVLIRAWSRVVVMKVVRVEDFLALGAFACYAAFMYPVVLFLHNTGFFVHQWNVPLSKISEFSYILLIGANLYAVNIMCLKVAIMLDWLRIFVPGKTRNAFFWICWSVLVCNTLYYIANIVALNLECIPYQSIWDITITGKCLDQKALDISSAVMNLLSDITVIAVAQKVIWRLQMSLKKKLGVSLIFAAGILGCVAGAFRLVVTIDYRKNNDATYYVSAVILWMTAEMTCGYLVFCVPAAPKAFSKVGVPTRLASALKSWKGRLSSRAKGSATKGSESGQPHGHRLSSLGFDSYQELPKTQLPVSEASLNGGSSFESTERLADCHTLPSDGIMMTTQTVTTLQRDYSNLYAAEEHGRQHPWTVESV